jgi:hypothetical protein
MLLTKCLPALVIASAAVAHRSASSPEQKPNILFIFTDDQDARQQSITTMSNVQKHIVKKGLEIENFYSPISLWCVGVVPHRGR